VIGFDRIMTRRAAPLWVAVGLIAGLALAFTLSTVQSVGAEGRTGVESITLSQTEVDFELGKSRSSEEVWIRGSGFAPGIEVVILVSDAQGALYIISNCRLNDDRVCNPRNRRDGGGLPWPLMTNDDGGFASNWRLGRFTRANVGWSATPEGTIVIGERMDTVWAVNGETYEFLASAPLAFCNLTRNEGLEEGATPAEVPSFCSA
jgi:hypothetical protein